MKIDAAELARQERIYWEAFAASLAEYAETNELSGEQMAEKLGVDPGTYSRTVGGRERQPRIGRAARFARILGLSLDEMVRPAAMDESADQKEAETIAADQAGQPDAPLEPKAAQAKKR